MHLFLYEHTCSVIQPHPPSLKAEGRAMLGAIHDDFARVVGVEVRTMRVNPDEEEASFRQLVRQSDYTMVVAPELDDTLLTRCRWVAEEGGRLLGPTLDAVRLTADKLGLRELLRRHGVRTPECVREPTLGSWVYKPRCGAGSTATFLVHDSDELRKCAEQARAECWHGESILQRHVLGKHVSVAFLTGPRQRLPLLPCAQELSDDGRFRYLGGYLPLEEGLAERAVNLARRAVDTVPGLYGYVGVDLVLGGAEDGNDDWVIEINPRLTTSYVGLRELARSNLAWSLLRLARGEPIEPIRWKPGKVRFSAGSTVADTSGS